MERWNYCFEAKVFLDHLERTFPARELFIKLENSEKCRNILWTSAEKTRVIAILEYYKITEKFRDIVFSKKVDVEKDIMKICRIFECSQEDVIFFDDNLRVIQELKRLKLIYNPTLWLELAVVFVKKRVC